MNLDKDDLFRNALPGFVFVLVVLSFFVAMDGWKIAEQVPNVLTLFLCFPLGFIIQSVHRVLHILFEQRRMQQQDMDTLRRRIRRRAENIFQGVNGFQQALAQWFAFSLNRDENRPFRERIDFLNTYFQTLGACCIAVIVALLFVISIKCGCCELFGFPSLREILPIWKKCQTIFVIRSFWIPALLWLFIAFFLLIGRRRARIDYQISRRVFIRLARIWQRGLLVPG